MTTRTVELPENEVPEKVNIDGKWILLIGIRISSGDREYLALTNIIGKHEE